MVGFFAGAAPDGAAPLRILRSSRLSASICSLIAAAQLSPYAVLIKLGDKISNVLDVTHSPPADWNLERRREYLDWAEAVVKNCRKVNAPLEQRFSHVLAEGRRILL